VHLVTTVSPRPSEPEEQSPEATVSLQSFRQVECLTYI
jgi:hypothetical protein